MKKLALFLFAATSLLGSGSKASAQYFYDGRYFYGPGPSQGGQYSDGEYYRERGYGPGEAMLGYNSYGKPEAWYPVEPGGICPKGHTVQDGVCKRYRGY